MSTIEIIIILEVLAQAVQAAGIIAILFQVRRIRRGKV